LVKALYRSAFRRKSSVILALRRTYLLAKAGETGPYCLSRWP
jgi:hypothetical protein